jgi:hypothetical protein
MKFNISFKKQPKETGLRAVGYTHSSIDIKVNKKRVGLISAPNWQKKGWTIRISIMKPEPDDNPNCDWKWISVKTAFEDEQSARQWVKDNLKSVAEKFSLHYFED